MAAKLGRPVTQQEIADAMRVHSVTVGRWEGNVKEPDLATIAQLAKVLGVDPRWLAFGDVRSVAVMDAPTVQPSSTRSAGASEGKKKRPA